MTRIKGAGCFVVLFVGFVLVAVLVLPNVASKLVESQIAVAKADLVTIHQALESYAIENQGRYPDSLEARLSLAATETLAIVAYRQPVTGPEIQELRSVNSSGVLRKLLERRLIRIAGRKEVVGKPFLYATTREFLQHFGLRSLKDLPPLEQFEELEE